MNPLVVKHLHEMDDDIHLAMKRCAESLRDSCGSLDESLEAMGGMIEILSTHHQSAIWALIGSTMEMSKFGMDVPNRALKETVDNCINTFSTELLDGIKDGCKKEGHSNFMDPNESIREEILNGNL